MNRQAQVAALFFLSGAAGLVYQALWMRRLSVVFGVTVYAASTVLAAFMAGLALGGMLASRALRSRRPPLFMFALCEILVGASALASPLLLNVVDLAYGRVHEAFPESLAVLTIARLIGSFAALVVPTTLMGMTLPVLAAAVDGHGRAHGSATNGLYILNTTGAMAGVLLTGFVLIPFIGIERSFLLAAATNFIVGGGAMVLARNADHAAATAASTADVHAPVRDFRLWLAVAISGFACLGLEVVWFRLMLQFVEATSEAFTAMLATVLAGIVAGSVMAAALIRRARDLRWWLTVSMVATGALTLLSMRALLWLTAHDTLPITLWVAVGIAILPPSILMGAGFPLGMTIAMRVQAGVRQMAEQVGKVYASNVAGAIAGSLITGFLLLPWLGSRQSLILLAALFIAGGLVMVTRTRPARRAPIVVALVLITGATVARFPDPFKVAIDRRYGDLLPEFWRHESAQSAVSVRATTLRHTLYINGLHQANDHPEMVKVHRMIGHLPMVLHGGAKEVLVVGLGGGATPGAVSQHDGATVHVVELSEGVRRAATLFAHVNYDVVNQPNVRIRVDDGRNFMRRVNGRFDVITADLIQPGHAGAGLVYSREYFELARRALKDDGVMLQWIGHRPSVEYALIMRTFLSVFPDATLV